jgi:hypothetical protein
VLYLERPAHQIAVACSWAGRFGYSDLKEGRRDGSLCPLNGAQRLRMVKIFSLTSWIRRFERWMERFGVTVSRHEEGEAAASRAVFSR